MNLDFGIALKYAPFLLHASLYTILLTVASKFLGTTIGFALAVGRTSGPGWLRAAVWSYVWIFRGTPMLLHLAFVYYAAPLIGIRLDPIPAAIVAMTLSSSAYNCEILRSGLQAVHHGQIEAARAIGMTYAKVLRKIVVPQAVRIVIPPYMSNVISHTKNSSLASVVAVPEIMLTAQSLANSTYRYIELLTAAGVLYLTLTSILTWLQLYLERRTAYEKRGMSAAKRRRYGLAA
jgi:polar amino acid transport system permease protein/cystine transport system permease protein